MTDKELFEKTIEHYGVKNQIVKSIEEMSELTKALCKYFENTDKRMEPIILDAIDEEMADVEIMLEQLHLIFNNDEQVASRRKDKIERLDRRIKNVGYIHGI